MGNFSYKVWGNYPLNSGSDTQKCTVALVDVIVVITALNDELYENLSNGYAVHLDGSAISSESEVCRT